MKPIITFCALALLALGLSVSSVEAKGKTPKTFQIDGVTKVSVPSGCEVDTGFFKGFGRDNSILEEAHQSWSWPKDLALTDLLDDLNTTLLDQIRAAGEEEDIPTDLHELKRFTATRAYGSVIQGGTAQAYTAREEQKKLLTRIDRLLARIDRLEGDLKEKTTAIFGISTTTYIMVAVTIIIGIAGIAGARFFYTRGAVIRRKIRDNSLGAIEKILAYLEARGHNVNLIRVALQRHVYEDEGQEMAQRAALRLAAQDADRDVVRAGARDAA